MFSFSRRGIVFVFTLSLSLIHRRNIVFVFKAHKQQTAKFKCMNASERTGTAYVHTLVAEGVRSENKIILSCVVPSPSLSLSLSLSWTQPWLTHCRLFYAEAFLSFYRVFDSWALRARGSPWYSTAGPLRAGGSPWYSTAGPRLAGTVDGPSLGWLVCTLCRKMNHCVDYYSQSKIHQVISKETNFILWKLLGLKRIREM